MSQPKNMNPTSSSNHKTVKVVRSKCIRSKLRFGVQKKYKGSDCKSQFCDGDGGLNAYSISGRVLRKGNIIYNKYTHSTHNMYHIHCLYIYYLHISMYYIDVCVYILRDLF